MGSLYLWNNLLLVYKNAATFCRVYLWLALYIRMALNVVSLEGKMSELYMIQLEEVVNGYIVSHGKFGETRKEFVERRIDALDLIVKIARREYGNEATSLLNVVSPGANTTEPNDNPGGTD